MVETKIMTPEEFELEMKRSFRSGDIEANHSKADDLMCKLLTSLGYGAGVVVYEAEEKWYA